MSVQPITNSTNIKIVQVDGDSITFEYDTMPGNMPNTYNNFVAIWQNQDQIPWNQSPIQSQRISSNTQAGSMIFKGLNVSTNSYIIGYSVGQNTTNICTTAFVPAIGNGDNKYTTPSLALEYAGATSVTVSFSTPTGYTPKTNNNWVGIWHANTVPYTIQPMASAPIGTDSNTGSAGINGIVLQRSSTYTIGYFTGRDLSTLATSLTFTV